MTRTYTMKRRAERQAETRRRIVEAAVDLHTNIGPAQTTFSMVAEKAGVQRHTLYAHFPDERSLLMACSGLHAERSPIPDAAPWRAIADPGERLRAGLGAIYSWFAENARLLANVLRDEDFNPLVREISQLRFAPPMKACADVLGEPLNARQRALLNVALGFFTWRSLVQDSALTQDAAVDLMVQAVLNAK
jgi:AcrR family transcriptional regulator